jgi:carbonic anhydrase
MREHYAVDCVDMVTEPGVDAILSEGKDERLIESLKRKIKISLEKHGSKLIAVVGHHDCAANPVEKETHFRHIVAAVRLVKSWGSEAEVVGVWVDEHWNAHEIAQRGNPSP